MSGRPIKRTLRDFALCRDSGTVCYTHVFLLCERS